MKHTFASIALLALTLDMAMAQNRQEAPFQQNLRGEATSAVQIVDPGVSEAKIIDSKVRQGDRLFVMARDMGGLERVDELLRSSDTEKIRTTLAAYGIGYSRLPDAEEVNARQEIDQSATAVDPLPADLPTTGCPQFYTPPYRMRIFGSGTETFYIDASGRPGYATYVGNPLVPVVPTSRLPCGTKVGTWGVPGDDGGHLIPNALGGSQLRVNFTPPQKNLSLNRGVLRAYIEDAVVQCRKVGMAGYRIVPNYEGVQDVRPTTYNILITTQIAGKPVAGPLAYGVMLLRNLVGSPVSASDVATAKDIKQKVISLCTGVQAP